MGTEGVVFNEMQSIFHLQIKKFSKKIIKNKTLMNKELSLAK